MLQFRRQRSKELHANQNYLNFIKKNHQIIQDSFNEQMFDKFSGIKARGTSTLALKVDHEDSPPPRKAIHDSLSRFQNNPATAPLSQMVQPTRDPESYDEIKKQNDSIAQQLLSQKHLKQQKTKDLLFHLNKSRSPNGRKVEIKQIKASRYQSIQQPATEMNLKFPIIEKKNIATLDPQISEDRPMFLNELRDRIKKIQHKKNDDTEEERKSCESSKTSKDRKEYEEKLRMREQLYGLLPSFRGGTSNRVNDRNKKVAMHKPHILIQKTHNLPLKDVLQDYLQQNITTKSIPYNHQSRRDKRPGIRQINPEEIAESLHRDELALVQERPQSHMDSIEPKEEKYEEKESPYTGKEVAPASQPIRKIKKVPQQLKYNKQLSIYEQKIRAYRDFLFIVNMAHRIYDPIILKDSTSFKPEQKYRFYLGKGNNYLLVKSLLKRRFWWGVEEDPKKANFVWTQLKVNYYYQLQSKARPQQRHHKIEEPPSPLSPKKIKKKPSEKPQPVKAGIYKAPLPAPPSKVLTKVDLKHYTEFLEQVKNPQKVLNFDKRVKCFPQNFMRERQQQIGNEHVHNHLEFNYYIGNKKALFYNLKQYYDLLEKDVFSVLPLTYHIKQGMADPQYDNFVKQFKKNAKDKKTTKNVWIVKPGELSNRGQGITVIDEIYELNTILKKKQKHSNGTSKTYIVQKYLERPLLYKGRKFDIRHYMMISRLHGVMRAYWFGQGYIRTSCFDYDLNELDESIHLTNDAIQKHCDGYGKFEEGNKVSYNEFQRYMDTTVGEGKFSFTNMIYPKMKSIALDAVKATYLQLDPNNGQHNFEIFGLDYMIDSNYDVWLIEVNTNPCLEISSKLLARLIPTMVEQALRLTLDVVFPPPNHYPNSQKYLAPDSPLDRLQYELIFDEDRDGRQIEELYKHAKKLDMGEVDEQDEIYENDGKEIELDNEID